VTSGVDLVASALPWRTFRWHMGQRHYSGSFWSSTQRDHVIYESRLELAVLLSADFDRSVVGSWLSRSCFAPRSAVSPADTFRIICC